MIEVSVMAGRYVLAVSGGVDSVVLLDILSNQPNLELIVAHFDHGIRDDSSHDAELVKGLAEKYGLKFESKREELGKDASEDIARNRRYDFLRKLAKKYDAKLITAHHADDVIESIVINLYRGTGWRGLAVLDSDVVRPLTVATKQEILDYAVNNGLEWREDSTNLSHKYLRNRIRGKVKKLDNNAKTQLLEIWNRQKNLKKMINEEVGRFVDDRLTYGRYFFINIDETVAIECLRRVVGARLTRPQLYNLLYKIKTALPGRKYQAGGGININFSSRNFTVELIK